MVAAHPDPHALAGNDLILGVDDGLFRDRADREDRGLGRVDDGVEVADAEGAEVRDGDGAAGHFVRGQLFVACPDGEILELGGEVLDRFRLGGADHRGDESVLDRDGDGEVGLTMVENRVALEGAVHLGHGTGREDGGAHDEIVHRVLRSAVRGARGVDLFAQVHERFGVDLDVEIEMRDRRLALEKARGNDATHAGERHATVRFRHGRRKQSEGAAATTDGGVLDIFLHDASARPAPVEAGEIDALLLGDLAGERRGLEAPGGDGRGGSDWCWRGGGSS